MLCGELVVPCNTQSTTAWQNTKGGLSRGGSGTDKECRYQGLVQWLFVNHVRAKAAALSKASHVPRGCFEGATYPDTASAGVVNLGCTVFKKQTAVLRPPFFYFLILTVYRFFYPSLLEIKFQTCVVDNHPDVGGILRPVLFGDVFTPL